MRQERSGSVPVNSLQNVSGRGTPVRAEGGRLFVDAPGEQVLISSLARQPQENHLLTSMQTAETFELSLDITPHDGAPPNWFRNIVHFGNSNTQRLPGFFLYPGSTRLNACVSREAGNSYGHQVSDSHLIITIHTHLLSSVIMYTCAPATDHDLDDCLLAQDVSASEKKSST